MICKKGKFFLVIYLFLFLSLSGCGMQASPDKVVEKYCAELLTTGKMYDKLVDNLSAENKRSKDVKFSDNQIQRLASACVERIRKCHIQSKVLAINGNDAKVEVTVERVKVDKILNEKNTKEQLLQKTQNIYDMKQKYNIAIDMLIDAIPQAPVDGTKSFTVECNYNQEKKEWTIKYPDGVLRNYFDSALSGI